MRILLVDGHSVIFNWPELAKLHARKMILAREELIRQLNAYQDSSGVRVVVVFDGQGAKPKDESTPGGAQIFYSATGQSADQVMERLTAKYATTYDITVATSDHLVQQTCITFGALAITPDELKTRFESTAHDFGRLMKKHRRK